MFISLIKMILLGVLQMQLLCACVRSCPESDMFGGVGRNVRGSGCLRKHTS